MGNVNIIGEIGINHNGDIELAKKVIERFLYAGISMFKLQKRNPLLCVPDSQKSKPKQVPWRNEETTYLQYKQDIEFSYKEYEELYKFIDSLGVPKPVLFASVWDIDSAKFMRDFTDIVKIPSAKITDLELMEYCRTAFEFKMMSTGMSTEKEIKQGVFHLLPDVIFHTNSSYPTPLDKTKLEFIPRLKILFPSTQVGYSNHCTDPLAVYVAVALRARWIELHITLDKNSWGSDQASSFEPKEVEEMYKHIEWIWYCNKDLGNPRIVFPEEESKRKSLRG